MGDVVGAVKGPVPVGYETFLGASLSEGGFVEGEEVAMPGEEGGDEVDCSRLVVLVGVDL